MASSDGTPRKQPRRRQSKEIVEAIREATRRILTQDGLDGLTTNRIADVAGVSVGSVYQYFPDKQAVIAELSREVERRALELVRERLARLAPDDVDGLVTTLIDVLFDAEFGEWQLRRAVQLEVPPKWTRGTAREVDGAVHAEVSAFLARNADALRPGLDPSLAAFLLLRAGEHVVEAAIADAPELFERDVLGRELKLMALRYLYP